MKTLYLGLDPKNYPNKNSLVHYPVIRTIPLEEDALRIAETLWPAFTHVVFTSQTTVAYWHMPIKDKICIAIGEATAAAIRLKGSVPLVAPQATQEGVVEFLAGLDLREAFLFLPRSRLARNTLTEYLDRSRIHYFALDLYDTVFQKPEPVPNLDEFDEIVFTSPSTVEGFLKIFGKLPRDKKLTSIGPVTKKCLCILAEDSDGFFGRMKGTIKVVGEIISPVDEVWDVSR